MMMIFMDHDKGAGESVPLALFPLLIVQFHVTFKHDGQKIQVAWNMEGDVAIY